MGKSNFENLRTYRQAEELADEIWEIVSQWDPFAKETITHLVSLADHLAPQLNAFLNSIGRLEKPRKVSDL